MRMYQLNCPACGATIEIEKSRKSCYCTYCGNKIYLDDGVERIEITKNINYHETYTDEAKIKDIEVKERMQDKKLAADREKRNQKQKEQRFITMACVLGCVFIMGGFLISERIASDQQEEELEKIVEEVLEDIEKGDFKAAHIKAETIYYTANWSDEIEEKWNSTRMEIMDQIELAEKKAENAEKEAKKTEKKKKKTESKKTWWNPFD